MARFTSSEIDALLDRGPISATPPWSTDQDAVEAVLRALCVQLKGQLNLCSRIEWDHYGCGYASFVDAWFYRPTPEFKSKQVIPKSEGYEGLVVLFARFAPYYVFMQGTKHWDKRGGSDYLPDAMMVDALDAPAVIALAGEMQPLLARAGLTRLSSSDLAAPLDPDIAVPTILSQPPFTQFDALFHWED